MWSWPEWTHTTRTEWILCVWMRKRVKSTCSPSNPVRGAPFLTSTPRQPKATRRWGDTLRTYRKDQRLDGAITFGMNAIVRQGAGQMLRVGQRVAANLRFD